MSFLLLFCAALIAGTLNSVAGGGSFFTFPMLLFTGMNPVIANATNTMAIWPGSVASVIAYKEEIQANRDRLPMLVTTSLVGSTIGAILLLKTPAPVFYKLIPYLLLFATVLFALSRRITRVLHRMRGVHMSEVGAFIMQTAIAFYGGYFGGGMGIMMLAMLSLMGLTDMHEMNGMKTVLGTMINGIAVLIFIVSGMIAWPQAVVMLTGAAIGGYYGARHARKVSADKVRKFVILTGLIMSFYFLLK